MILCIDTVQTTCWKCRCHYVLPMELYKAAKASSDIEFYCPYGHIAHFPAGETEEEKLRRERDRLAQQIAQRDDEIARQRRMRKEAERSLTAIKGHLTRSKKRAAAGTCPCCRRTFSNMAEHMKREHPQFVEESGAKVVPLKKVAARC